VDRSTLLILGSRLAQLPAITAARKLGLRVAAVDPDPQAIGLGVADARLVVDLADFEAILGFARRERVCGVVTLGADYPMPTLARLCAVLDLPGPSVDAVDKATNKRRMRDALAAAGVPCPNFRWARSADEARLALEEIGVDAVFKPAMSHGSRGVSLVPAGSPAKVVDAAYRHAERQTRADGVMIEAFVDGPECSVETLTYRGHSAIVAVTEKLTSTPPYFVELGHNQPSRFSAEERRLLGDCAVASLAALGIDNAAGHCEIRLAGAGPVVMEAAARLGGGFICSHLVPLSTGIDLVAATIEVALGRQPSLAPAHEGRPAAIRFLRALPGVVTEVLGVDAVASRAGVEEVAVYVRPGSTVPELVDDAGRAGHVICSAPTVDEAISLAEDAARGIDIRTCARQGIER